MLVWGIADIGRSWQHRRTILTGFALFATTACAAVTFAQISYWRDTDSLFRHAVTVTNNNYIAHNNLAAELIRRGEHVEAEQHLLEVLRIRRNHPGVYTNLGVVYMMQKRRDLAITAYRTAIQNDPQDKVAHYNLGCALAGDGDFDGAYVIYQRFLSIDPIQAKNLIDMINLRKTLDRTRNNNS